MRVASRALACLGVRFLPWLVVRPGSSPNLLFLVFVIFSLSKTLCACPSVHRTNIRAAGAQVSCDMMSERMERESSKRKGLERHYFHQWRQEHPMACLKTMGTNINDISGTPPSTCSGHQHSVTYRSLEKHHLPPALTRWLPASVLHAAWRRATAHPPIRHSPSGCLPSGCALLTWVPSTRRARPGTWVSRGDTPTAQLAWYSSGSHTYRRHWKTPMSRWQWPVKSLETLSYEKWLKKPVLFHLEQAAEKVIRSQIFKRLPRKPGCVAEASGAWHWKADVDSYR